MYVARELCMSRFSLGTHIICIQNAPFVIYTANAIWFEIISGSLPLPSPLSKVCLYTHTHSYCNILMMSFLFRPTPLELLSHPFIADTANEQPQVIHIQYLITMYVCIQGYLIVSYRRMDFHSRFCQVHSSSCIDAGI